VAANPGDAIHHYYLSSASMEGFHIHPSLLPMFKTPLPRRYAAWSSFGGIFCHGCRKN
jgi:hypothetical protein